MSGILEHIEEAVPTVCEFNEDARYNWPDRWRRAKEAVRAIEAENARLRDRTVRLREALDGVLTWALANRGSVHEFVRCHTYGCDVRGNHIIPEVIQGAKAALVETYETAPSEGD